MTNNIKYLRPLPIKALSGRVLKLSGDNALKAKQENARRRAKSEYYFDLAPSIPNLARGIYYWATSEPMLFGEDETPNVTKGVAPAVGASAVSAVKSVPQAARWVSLSLPGLAFLSSWLGGNSEKATPSALSVSRPVSRTRLLDKAEEATRDSTVTTPRDSISPSTPPPTNPNNNKDKKESTFKKESKKVIKNIGNVYGMALKGGAYGTGFLGIPGGIWYGIHQASKPAPTAVDSLLELQSRLMIELNKLELAKLNLMQIDAIKRKLLGTGDLQMPDSNSVKRATTTLTPTQLDSINNLFYEE